MIITLAAFWLSSSWWSLEKQAAEQLTNFSTGSSFGFDGSAENARSIWSSDGKTIYITCEIEPEDPGPDIWAISVDDGSMRKVLDFKRGDPYGHLNGVLTADGERLYFAESTFSSELWLAELSYQ